MTENLENDIELDLRDMVLLIWKNLIWIIQIGLCTGALVFLFVSVCMSKTYISTAELYILHQQSDRDTVTASDLQTGTYLTNDYKELIVSVPVLEKVIAQLNLAQNPAQLEKQITVDSPDNTRIIQISVEDTDPYQAQQIADVLCDSASEKISQVMDIESVKIVQEASYPDAKSGPARLKMTVVGCMTGVLLAVLFLVIYHVLDDTIKTTDDIEQALDLFVLGSIPEMKKENKRKRQR